MEICVNFIFSEDAANRDLTSFTIKYLHFIEWGMPLYLGYFIDGH